MQRVPNCGLFHYKGENVSYERNPQFGNESRTATIKKCENNSQHIVGVITYKLQLQPYGIHYCILLNWQWDWNEMERIRSLQTDFRDFIAFANTCAVRSLVKRRLDRFQTICLCSSFWCHSLLYEQYLSYFGSERIGSETNVFNKLQYCDTRGMYFRMAVKINLNIKNKIIENGKMKCEKKE